MKKVVFAISLICVLNSLVVSCSSDDDNPDPQPAITFNMTVNGQLFSTTSQPSAVLSNSGRYMVISGSNVTTSEVITLSIGNISGTGDMLTAGTYTLTGADSTTFNYFDGDNGFQGDNGGQIIITDINTETQEISGTFQGVASGSFGSTTTYTISNGSFGNLPYTIQ